MQTMRSILTRFNAFGKTHPQWKTNPETTRGFYDSSGCRPCSIGYANQATQEFVANNMDAELEYYFIMYPMVVVGFKNRKQFKGVSMFLCNETTYGIKNGTEHFSGQYHMKKYLNTFISELKQHATAGGVTFEEYSSDEFTAFMLLTKLEK